MNRLLHVVFMVFVVASTVRAVDRGPELGSSANEAPVALEVQLDPSLFESPSGHDKATAHEPGLYSRIVMKMRDKAPGKIRRLFSKLKVPAPVTESVIEGVTQNLDHALDTLPRAQAEGFTVPLVAFAGAGLNGQIGKIFRKKSWGALVPKEESMGVIVGSGIAMITFRHEGRQKLILRLFSDSGIVDRPINWIAEAFAGIIPGVHSEDVSPEAFTKRFYQETLIVRRAQMGLIGSLVSSPNSFEHGVAVGVQTPVISSFSFFDFIFLRKQINVVLDIEFANQLKHRLIRSCIWLLGY
ncbi:MAG: hypothetical protein ACK5Y2_01635 [Bdellovibrionales bacterium]